MTISETPQVYAWLRATLTPLARGGAHKGIAPEGTATPYIVYSFAGGLDVGGAGAPRLWSDGQYQVLVCGPDVAEEAPHDSTYADIVATADAVDAALEFVHGNTAVATIMRSIRMEPIEYGETVNGAQWSRLGARWRVLARKTG